jgi:hypothetical protein
MKAHELTRTIERAEDIPAALKWMERMTLSGLRGGDVLLVLTRERRTVDQNAKLWPMLEDIARQVEWYGFKLTKEDWKDIFTAALLGQRLVSGLNGGLVLVGGRTSTMTKAQFSDLIESIYAFGAERHVAWSEPAQAMIAERGLS